MLYIISFEQNPGRMFSLVARGMKDVHLQCQSRGVADNYDSYRSPSPSKSWLRGNLGPTTRLGNGVRLQTPFNHVEPGYPTPEVRGH